MCTAADGAGNIYVAGNFLGPASADGRRLRKAIVAKLATESADAAEFVAVNSLPTPAASNLGNAFISKPNAQGTALLSSSLVGATQFSAIALDADGNPVLACSTSASDYPVTPKAFQTSPPQGGFGIPVYVWFRASVRMHAGGSSLPFSAIVVHRAREEACV